MSETATTLRPEVVAVGVALGRFQPLHRMHLRYLLAAAERCRLLVVGITNPRPDRVLESNTDPYRSLLSSNPYSYAERREMVRASLIESGVEPRRFNVVPAQLGTPDLLNTLPSPEEARVLVTVYDAWGLERIDMLTQLGYRVDVLWHRPLSEKGITGTQVRHAIRTGGRWQELVPNAVVGLIERRGDTQKDARNCCPKGTAPWAAGRR